MAAKKKTERDEDNKERTRTIRDGAEKELMEKPMSPSEFTGKTHEELIHELMVNQIELEAHAEELRVAHLALEESRDRYIDLYDFAPLGYFTLNDMALITDVNLTGATLLGVERSKLINARFRKFVAEKDNNQWHRYFTQLLQQVKKQTCTLTLLPRDGNSFPARLEGIRLTGIDGAVTVRIAIGDITDIWQVETLRESEEKFRRIFETLDDVYYQADLQGNIFTISPSCQKLLGWTPEELTGTPITNYYLHPDDRTLLMADLQKNGSVHDYEVTLQHRDGRSVRLSVNAHITRDKVGNPAALEGTFREISRRLEMERALQRSAEYNRTLIEASVDPLVTIGTDGTITDVNKATEKATGILRENLIGTDFSDYFTEPYKARAGYRKVFHEGTVRDYPLELRHRDGSTISVLYSASVYRDESGAVVGVFAAARDISEHKGAEEALQRQAATLTILYEIITAANRADDLADVLIKVLDETMRLMDFDSGMIYLVDAGELTATIAHYKNIPPAFLEEVMTISTIETPYNAIFSRGTPVISAHYDEIDKERSKMSGFLSLASVPIVSRGRVIGTLNVASRERYAISAEEEQILLSIGQELGSTFGRLTASDQAKKSAYNLDTLFNSIEEMVFVLDMQGHILKVNDAVEQRLFYTQQELIGKNVLYLHVPERQDEAILIVQGMIEGTIDSCPVPVLAKDGTQIEVETKVTKGTWNDQDVLIGVTRDITDRKRAEEALKKSEELLNLAISGSGAGLWDLNIKTGEMVFNERWAEIVGYTLRELEPVSIETWISLTHPDDQAKSNELLAKYFAGDLPEYECEARMRHKKGLFVWVLDRGKITGWDNDGKPLRMTGTHLDITRRKELEMELEFHEKELVENATRLTNEIAERKRVEEEIKQLNQELEARVIERTEELAETVRKLRDENAERIRVEEVVRLINAKLALMNDVAYQDIQNKVTALRGIVDFIPLAKNEEERQAFIEKEKTILGTIHNLIIKTKDYQKMGTGKLQWLDMEQTIRRITLSHDKAVPINIDIHGLFIHSDPLISRVFDILTDNAVTHGKKTTCISFSCSRTPGGITLICEDDGVGILTGEKSQVFERVVAGEGKFDLFFVHEFLTLSGMAITETGEPGKGARFEITVPDGMWRKADPPL